MSVGNQLKRKRKEKKWSSKDLAIQLGVDEENINNWENGLGYPGVDEAQVLCQLLGLSMDELTADDEEFKELMLDVKVEKQVNKVMSILASILFFIVFLYGIYKLMKLGLESGVIVILAIGILGSTHFGKEAYRVASKEN